MPTTLPTVSSAELTGLAILFFLNDPLVGVVNTGPVLFILAESRHGIRNNLLRSGNAGSCGGSASIFAMVKLTGSTNRPFSSRLAKIR